MSDIKPVREKVYRSIVETLSGIQGVSSITFVGSFVTGDSILSISDIDIIVIVDELTEKIFRQIESNAGSLNGDDCGLPGYRVKLNMSFGPLKFNDDQTIVFHLMVYDIKGHRKHVIDSPFTCYDWEYFPAVYGKDLKEIYPAGGLQLDDLVGTRRGIESYLDDLTKGSISFRNYVFENDTITEKKETFPIDDRHKKEYAYHVMKFLMINLLKILEQKNNKYNDIVLAETFAAIDAVFEKHISFFISLSGWKRNGGAEPADIFENVAAFIHELSNWFAGITENLPEIIFIRHERTGLNDGTFLGTGRNPDIVPERSGELPDETFDVIYTSCLQRTISTGLLLKGDRRIQDKLLNEIAYGSAEGMRINELNKEYPEMIAAWHRKEDPRFPGGENQQDVAERLDAFIEDKLIVAAKKKIAVVTHNVVIRGLLAKFYAAPLDKWYLLAPGHLEPISFRIFKGALIPALEPGQRTRFKDQLVQWKQA